MAESTHRPPLTPILSLLNFGNRCQVRENVTFIEKNVRNDYKKNHYNDENDKRGEILSLPWIRSRDGILRWASHNSS